MKLFDIITNDTEASSYHVKLFEDAEKAIYDLETVAAEDIVRLQYLNKKLSEIILSGRGIN